MDRRADGLAVEELRNIGTVAGRQLRSVGIGNLGQLRAIGAVRAWRAARQAVPGVSVNALYAYEAALLDMPWREVNEEMRGRLRRAAGLESE